MQLNEISADLLPREMVSLRSSMDVTLASFLPFVKDEELHSVQNIYKEMLHTGKMRLLPVIASLIK